MKNYRPYLVFLLTLLVFFILFFTNYASSKIQVPDPQRLSAHWTYGDEVISLPVKLDVQRNESVVIKHVLSVDFHEPQVLMLRSSLQDVRIFLEDELIYEKTYGDSIIEPYASMWHFITLPRHIDGQVLSVELTSPYQAMSGQVNEMFYGTHAMHYAYLFRSYGLRLFIGLLTLIIGFIVMLSHFFFAKKQDRGFAYAGLFAILLSLWMIAESRMLQFFTGSELLIGSLAYLALPVFPLPFIRYLKEYVLKRYSKLLTVLMTIFVAQFFLIIVLYVSDVMDFFESVIISQILLSSGILLALVLLLIEVKKDNNEKAFRFIKGFMVLVVFAILEIINFIMGGFENISLYLSFGLLMIMVVLMVGYVKYLIGRLKLSYEKEFYERLAYIDHVTQGQNRLAFERDLEQILNDSVKRNELRLIMFDLDGLKKINDAYGHVEGDHAIKKAFDMITEVFGHQGMCYRIGGDEFACLFESINDALFHQKKSVLEGMIQIFEDETPYHFGLSLGSSILSDEHMNAKTLIKMADSDMYMYKNSHKTN